MSIFGIADTFCFRLSRCRVYSGLPSYCTLVADPTDSCCRVPKCQSGPINYQPIYNNMVGSSTPAPNAFNVVPIGSHNTIYGSNEIKPGSNNPFTASGGQSNHSSTIIMLLWRFLKKISIIIWELISQYNFSWKSYEIQTLLSKTLNLFFFNYLARSTISFFVCSAEYENYIINWKHRYQEFSVQLLLKCSSLSVLTFASLILFYRLQCLYIQGRPT